MGWTLGEAPVQVPRSADIPPQFWFERDQHHTVQRVLDVVDPMLSDAEVIVTEQLEGERFMPIVVPLNGHRPWWGIHAGHHANRPQASPFLRVDFDLVERTDLFTVVLTQMPHRPALVRAFPGDYIPPLPWMISADQAIGGKKACTDFWCRHAYVFRRSAMMSRRHAPDWFRPR